MNILNAAGTPITRLLPFNSRARFTLLPGEPSTRSTSGIGSPALTNAGAEVRKSWRRDGFENDEQVGWLYRKEVGRMHLL